jgi:ABC-type transporter Mla maintaining outer membrane lipid asymmetry ATPase subunit MlaF
VNRFAYPTRKDDVVLKDLTLEIPAGSRTAIVGPSGSARFVLLVDCLHLRIHSFGSDFSATGKLDRIFT